MSDKSFDKWWKETMHKTTYGDCRELFEKCWHAALRSTDYLKCQGVAAEIAEAIEGYEGDDLLSRIIPPLKPLIGVMELREKEIKRLRSAISAATVHLETMLGDTDIMHKEDDSPEFCAWQRLHAAAHNLPMCPVCNVTSLAKRGDSYRCSMCCGLFNANQVLEE